MKTKGNLLYLTRGDDVLSKMLPLIHKMSIDMMLFTEETVTYENASQDGTETGLRRQKYTIDGIFMRLRYFFFIFVKKTISMCFFQGITKYQK